MRPAYMIAFRRAATVFLMTASVESAQSEKFSECNGKVIVEEENPVFRADKRSGDPYIQFAEYAIEKLG